MTQLWWIISIIAAYLAGSIPFGWLIGRAHGLDIRQSGSGNIGATNLGRVLGRGWGFFCFLLDVLKGFVPTLVVGVAFGWIGSPDAPGLTAGDAGRWLAVGAAAIVGHMFPVWLKFKGGKGVATGLGVVLGVWPYLTLPGAAAAATWLLFAGALRYVSLASIMAALLLPGYVALAAATHGWPVQRVWPLVAVSGLMGLLVVIRHRANLVRLARGTEPKLG